MRKRVVIKSLVQAGVVGLLGLGLASCGGGGSNPSSIATTAPTPPTTVATPFGAGFAADFALAANSNPPKPSSSDVIPLTLVAGPAALH